MTYTKQELEDIAQAMAIKHGVDPDFYHSLITQESGFNPNAKSKVGATGIAQFMPSTAKGMGFDPTDPVASLDNGAKYLANHLAQVNGSYSLAAASYNAGLGAVQKYRGIPPYKETQNYVKNIMAMTNARKGQLEGENGLGKPIGNIQDQQNLNNNSSFKAPTWDEIQKARGEGQAQNQPSPDSLFHLPDLINAQYPGGVKEFMKQPVEARRQTINQFNRDYLSKQPYFQSQPVQAKVQYLKDQENYLLAPKQFDVGDAFHELGGNFMSAASGGNLGQATNSLTGMIGQFAGQAGGTLGATALGAALGSVVPGVGTAAGALAGAMLYGGVRGTSEALHENPTNVGGALASGGLEAGANALTMGLLGPESTLLKRAIVNMGVGGTTGGVANAIQQAQNTGNIDLGQAAQAAGQSALTQTLFGEALHQVPHLLGKGADFLGRPIQNEVKTPASDVSTEVTGEVEPKQEFNPNHPDWNDKVMEHATNPESIKVYEKANNARLSKLAKDVKFDPLAAEEPLTPQQQFAKEVVETAKGLKEKPSEIVMTDKGEMVKTPEGELIQKAPESVELYRGVKEGKLGEDTSSSIGNALFYSPHEEVAKNYAGEKGSISKSSIEFKNRLDTENWMEAKQKLGLEPSATMEDLIREARSQGYDGLSFNTTNGKEYVYIPSEQAPLQGGISKTITPPSALEDYNSLPQLQGSHQTLDELLKDPYNMEYWENLPIETQHNMLYAEQAAMDGKRLNLYNFQPKTGYMSSGTEGIFTMPEEDKFVSPIGFERTKNGIYLKAYNNNLMERSYPFKTSDEGFGIGAVAQSPELAHIGPKANAYQTPGRYLPNSTFMDKALTQLSREDIMALSQPNTTMPHSLARAKVTELFPNEPDRANWVYNTLADQKFKYDYIEERLGTKAVDALRSGVWDNTTKYEVEKALKSDKSLQILANSLGCP